MRRDPVSFLAGQAVVQIMMQTNPLTFMSEAAQKAEREMVVPCPVCGSPLMFADGGFDIERQVSFPCTSRKCRGKKRYIKKSDLKIIVDKFNQDGA
jgi:hypothetical protein